MRAILSFSLLLLVAAMGSACDGQPMCGGEELDLENDLETVSLSCDGEDGFGGSGPGSDDYIDSSGICRTDGDFHGLGCQPTYELALAAERCGGGTPACAGACGGWLVVQDSCTPALGCTYDPLSRALVGVVVSGDGEEHCGGASISITYGDGYHGCAFQDLVLDRACWLKGG